MSRSTPPSARSRILEVVDRLFYTEGVRPTGTEKIMAEAGVAKATFYRHFPSKDELVLAYLEQRDQALWSFLEGADDLPEVLRRFEQWASQPEVVGCPFLRIASEYPEPQHPFHRFAIQHQEKIRDFLAGLLDASIPDRTEAANALLAVIDGALTLRMLYGASARTQIVRPAQAILAALRVPAS